MLKSDEKTIIKRLLQKEIFNFEDSIKERHKWDEEDIEEFENHIEKLKKIINKM